MRWRIWQDLCFSVQSLHSSLNINALRESPNLCERKEITRYVSSQKSSLYFLENCFTSLLLETPIQLHRTPSSQRCESPSSVFFSDYIQDIPRDGQKQRQKPSLWMKQKHGRREKAKMIKRTDANVYTSTPNFWLFSIISIFPISPTKTYSLKQKNDMSQNSKALLVTSTCTARPPPTFACRPDKKDLPRSIFGAPVCLKRDFSVESPQLASTSYFGNDPCFRGVKEVLNKGPFSNNDLVVLSEEIFKAVDVGYFGGRHHLGDEKASKPGKKWENTM